MMTVILVFMLGIANFAMHRAVMESRHPVLREIPWLAHRRGRNMALGLEFLVLVAALALGKMGFPMAVLAYGFYSACNGLMAWMILTRRM